MARCVVGSVSLPLMSWFASSHDLSMVCKGKNRFGEMNPSFVRV